MSEIAAESAGSCYFAWPDRNTVGNHVCIVKGEHALHHCGVCGPSVTPPDSTETEA